ncbi:ABC transporter permease [Roseospira goensis]|uniref:Osmoprotectant transport system permease protein n=1 Tax=Roseospira goensis TaxID=391922 RepID=A0A7W6RXZ8_9PROT|nr:ABC transporter permease [Roseospira goensis]MBB4284785.1 osmoprotectant transport system permease protein [Roseospira goensis]
MSMSMGMAVPRSVWMWVLVVGAFALGAWAQSAGLIADILWRWEDIVFLARQHMQLVAISGGLAILVGVPLGILLSRPAMRRMAETLMQGLNVGTTIPTLAVLALSMTFLGIGTVPAIFALWIASLLPIVRNTYIGILEVPAALREAAQGMGMTNLQMLWRVELPNALWVIFAGIRTALAINVGTVPLAFLIGGGGLGELIFTGIALAETGMMLAGAIPTAILAVLTDFLVATVARFTVPRGVNPLAR